MLSFMADDIRPMIDFCLCKSKEYRAETYRANKLFGCKLFGVNLAYCFDFVIACNLS